MTFSVFSK